MLSNFIGSYANTAYIRFRWAQATQIWEDEK